MYYRKLERERERLPSDFSIVKKKNILRQYLPKVSLFRDPRGSWLMGSLIFSIDTES